jgi:hypothetical protein
MQALVCYAADVAYFGVRSVVHPLDVLTATTLTLYFCLMIRYASRSYLQALAAVVGVGASGVAFMIARRARSRGELAVYLKWHTRWHVWVSATGAAFTVLGVLEEPTTAAPMLSPWVFAKSTVAIIGLNFASRVPRVRYRADPRNRVSGTAS